MNLIGTASKCQASAKPQCHSPCCWHAVPVRWHSYRPGFPILFASLTWTCRLEQYITVLGASWCSHSTWEQHTVVYPIGKNLLKTRASVPINNHTVIIVYSIPVKCPKSKGLQGRQSSEIFCVIINYWIDLMGVDFPHRRISAAPQKYPPWSTTI